VVKLEEHARSLDFKGLIIASIMSALGFVVALFWKDAIKETINQFVPEGEGLLYMYLTAILVTILVVIIAYLVMRSQKIADKLANEARTKIKRSIQKKK
jgi:hypothetical protein